MYNQYLKSTKELPPVLTQEKEKELIKNIEKPEAREKLIEELKEKLSSEYQQLREKNAAQAPKTVPLEEAQKNKLNLF